MGCCILPGWLCPSPLPLKLVSCSGHLVGSQPPLGDVGHVGYTQLVAKLYSVREIASAYLSQQNPTILSQAEAT